MEENTGHSYDVVMKSKTLWSRRNFKRVFFEDKILLVDEMYQKKVVKVINDFENEL